MGRVSPRRMVLLGILGEEKEQENSGAVPHLVPSSSIQQALLTERIPFNHRPQRGGRLPDGRWQLLCAASMRPMTPSAGTSSMFFCLPTVNLILYQGAP